MPITHTQTNTRKTLTQRKLQNWQKTLNNKWQEKLRTQQTYLCECLYFLFVGIYNMFCCTILIFFLVYFSSYFSLVSVNRLLVVELLQKCLFYYVCNDVSYQLTFTRNTETSLNLVFCLPTFGLCFSTLKSGNCDHLCLLHSDDIACLYN